MSAPLRSEPSSNRHAGTPRPASATAPSPPFGSKPAVAKTAARPRSSSNAPNASNTSIRPSTDTRPMPRLSRSELADFTVQLAVMIRTGLDVATALTSLCRLAGSKRTRRLYERLADDVMAGLPLSKALAQHERIFGATYVATLSAGESSGALSKVLEQLADLLRAETNLQTKVRGMLAYPVLLTGVSSLVITGLVMFVLPQFARIFEQQGTPLPLLTRTLLAISSTCASTVWIWLPLLIAGVVGLFFWRGTDAGRSAIDRAKLDLPIIGGLLRRAYVARFCRLLGIMCQNGVPMLECLSILSRSIPNRLYVRMLGEVEDSVLNGGSVTEVLLGTRFIPGSAAEMLATGERTGTLGSVSMTLADHFDTEAESRLRETLTFVEPVLTLGLGFIVSLVVLSVTLPMFDMATFAK